MEIRNMTEASLKRLVKKIFGGSVEYDRIDGICHVHLDSADAEARAGRVQGFDPWGVFDRKCPHCQPFVAKGCFMLWDGPSLTGLRPLPGGAFESVILRADMN